MSARFLALISVALNLCLLGGWRFQGRDRSQASPLQVTPSPQLHTAPSRSVRSTRVPDPPQWQWADIADTNLARYTENLRTLECPEPIVQRIIVAEIDRIFRTRWDNRPCETNFWRTGGEKFKLRCAQRVAKGRLEMERRALIFDILGARWHELTFRTWDVELIRGFSMLFGPLPAADQARIQAHLLRYVDFHEDLEAYSPDRQIVTPQELAERLELQRQLFAETVQVLTPAQLDEAELRVMSFGVLDVWSIPQQFGNEFTPTELREFLRIKKTGQNILSLLIDDDDRPPLTEELKQQQEQQIRTLLGDTRYGGYQRAQDSEFRFLHRALGNFDQPIEAVWQVYDLQTAAFAAAARIQQDSDLPAPQRAEALAAIQRETETALRQALGAVTADQYLRAQQRDWAKRFDPRLQER